MKLSKCCFGIVGLLLYSAMFFSSCEGGVSGNAPSNVAGKTIEILGSEGDPLYTISFSSNTSAKITYLYDVKGTYSSIKYKKTGAESATIQIKGLTCEDWFKNIDENLSLIFASPNQGIVNSRWSFTIF